MHIKREKCRVHVFCLGFCCYKWQKMVDPYWPDEINVPVRHGELTVTMTGVSVLDAYAMRQIKVTMVGVVYISLINRSKLYINIFRALESNFMH